MIVKLIAPGILPGDYVTADLPAVPRKGETIAVYNKATHIEETLTVHEVVWPITPFTMDGGRRATADMPEVVCDRAEDVGDNPGWFTRMCTANGISPEKVIEMKEGLAHGN